MKKRSTTKRQRSAALATKVPVGWMDRTTSAPTPTWLKGVIIVQGFFFVVLAGIQVPFHLGMLLPAAFLTMGITALVALWRLRRWSVYALLALVAMYFATKVGLLLGDAYRGVVAGVICRSLGIAAGIVLWKKLT